MPINAKRIEIIAQEEIEHVENPALRKRAQDLLTQWRDSDPNGHFCETVLHPEILGYSRKKRKAASRLLRGIKERISDEASQQALNSEKQRQSAEAMKREILATYELIERQGRGVVYFGSARTTPGDKEYELARELGREVSLLLGSTTWSGAGPGQMEAPMYGAKEVGGKIGGIKILLKSEEHAFEQEVSSIFGDDEVVICDYFGPRKIGLVDAGMRRDESDRTAFIVTPGGFGTLDEMYEKVVLEQTGKLGSKKFVPAIIMNYGGFFDTLLKFHEELAVKGKISPTDINRFTVCDSNGDALDFLAEFYGISRDTQSKNIIQMKNGTEH